MYKNQHRACSLISRHICAWYKINIIVVTWHKLGCTRCIVQCTPIYVQCSPQALSAQHSLPPMPSIALFLWYGNQNDWCDHKLRPNHAHPLGLHFILGRTLISCSWFVVSWSLFITRLAYFIITHTLPIADKLPIKTLVARQLPV